MGIRLRGHVHHGIHVGNSVTVSIKDVDIKGDWSTADTEGEGGGPCGEARQRVRGEG